MPIPVSTEVESAGADTPIPTWLNMDPADLVLKNKIGGGSFGYVYEASWRGHIVAAKEMPREAPDLFELEASILAKLRSPFIVRLIGTCIKDSHLYLVMELVSSTLEQFLEDRSTRGRPPLSLPVAVDIMLQISRAMEYLHSQEIMHLDLKASNVLFELSSVPEEREEGYGQVKLCDFGTASCRLFSFRDFPRGTCQWRAPEVFSPPSQDMSAEANTSENYTHQDASAETNTPETFTYKADVYSFAMTCYEILTGKQPFSGVQPGKLHTMIVNGERPTLGPSICPFILANYIQQCWDTDPDHRPCFEAVSNFLCKLKSYISKFPFDGKGALNGRFLYLGFVDGEKKSIFSDKLEKWKKLDLAAMYSRLDGMLVEWRFLTLQMRRGIAIDIASFLANIHGAKRFLNLCLDSSTIFLDWELKPIFSGVVLATPISSSVAKGTPYGRPRKEQAMRFEEFTNTQNFGGLLVELSTGCTWKNRAFSIASIQRRIECLQSDFVDGQLVKEMGKMGERQLWEVVRWCKLGLWCLSKSPSQQPNIQTVLQLLKEGDPFHLPPDSTLPAYLSPIPTIEKVRDLSCPYVDLHLDNEAVELKHAWESFVSSPVPFVSSPVPCFPVCGSFWFGVRSESLPQTLQDIRHQTKMPSTIMVLKVELNCEKCKRRAMKIVVGEPGVESVQVDSKDRKMTVVGNADEVEIVLKLRKFGYTEILRVGPAKEEKKDEKQKEERKKDAKKDAATPAPMRAYVNVLEVMDPYGAYSDFLSEKDPNACAIS